MELGIKIASALHEDWRKTRLNEDGSYEPRWKKIKDESFIENLDEDNLPANIKKTEEGYEIDIANSTYEQLSPDWQEENKQAGIVVSKILECGISYTREEVGTMIHNEWLKRNEWAKGGELDVPFIELSKEEQDKDIAQYLIGLKVKNEKTISKEPENE